MTECLSAVGHESPLERMQAILDEARRLGCPDPVGLSSFFR